MVVRTKTIVKRLLSKNLPIGQLMHKEIRDTGIKNQCGIATLFQYFAFENHSLWL